jgi:hypothetical protein
MKERPLFVFNPNLSFNVSSIHIAFVDNKPGTMLDNQPKHRWNGARLQLFTNLVESLQKRVDPARTEPAKEGL